MKVTASEIEGSQVVLDMEIEPERVEKAMERAYRQIASRVNVPGFRRGKAPRVLVERVVGRESLMNEALELLLPEAYKEAVRETGIDPVDNPKLDVVSAEPLSVRATVPVRPKVELGEYRAIRQTVEVLEVTEEQVGSALENLRQAHAEWSPVERAAAQGDMVTLDLKGRVDIGERAFVDSQGFQVILDPARPILAPGVIEQLVGMKAGDAKAFDVTLPQDFQDKDLAGHEAAIEAAVSEVKEKRVPEMDDEMARTMGEFSSMIELQAAVRSDLEKQAQAQAKRNLEETILATVVDQASAEPPAPWVKEQAEGLAQDTKDDLKKSGLTFEQFLRFSNRTEVAYNEEMLSGARRQLKRMLVLGAVAEAESVVVTDEEVMAALDLAVAAREGKISDGDKERLKTSIESRLRERKTIDRLVEIATGGEKAEEVSGAERNVAGESQAED